ncbi:hypothetical protein [Mesorhizobium sp.]|nr:hypothetical protein [Mesorhizobium sp.]
MRKGLLFLLGVAVDFGIAALGEHLFGLDFTYCLAVMACLTANSVSARTS